MSATVEVILYLAVGVAVVWCTRYLENREK